MIREIVKPEGNTYILNLPDEMVGKMIEITAFEVEKTNYISTEIPFNPEKLQEINERYNKLPQISHENYKFNRDEANNYE